MSTDHSPDLSSAESDRFVFQAEPDQPLSEAIIVAIAEQAGHDDPITIAQEFDPLYNAIDPGALDALFDDSESTDRSSGAVTFTYADRQIMVDTSGRVELVQES